jgi:hypothetical protein
LFESRKRTKESRQKKKKMSALPIRSASAWIAAELMHRMPPALLKRVTVQSFHANLAEADAELCWRVAANPLMRIQQYTLYDPRPLNEPANLTLEQRVEHLRKHGGARDFLIQEIGVPVRRITAEAREALRNEPTSPLISLFHNAHHMVNDEFSTALQHVTGANGSSFTFVVGNKILPLYAAFRQYGARRMPADLVFHVHDEPFVLGKGAFPADFADHVFGELLADKSSSVHEQLVEFVDAAKRRLATTGELHMRDDLVVVIENRPVLHRTLEALQNA